MAKAAQLTASDFAEAYGTNVEIKRNQINISGQTPKVILLNGQQIWPVLAAVHAVQSGAANMPMDMGGLRLLRSIVRKLDLKPGDANASKDLLPAKTGLGGLALAGLMRDNGDALITTPHNLPVHVNWNTLAERATEADIQNQFINVHHLFKAQCSHDYGFQDWRAPNMKCEDSSQADESQMLWKFSNTGGMQIFDKSGAWPGSAFWAARRHSNLEACYVWADIDNQHKYWPSYGDNSEKLPVRPVRRVSLSRGPT